MRRIQYIQLYVCEVCNNSYDYESQALGCEAKHVREAKQEACKDHTFEYELNIDGETDYDYCYGVTKIDRTCAMCKMNQSVKLDTDSLTKEELEIIFNRLLNQ